MRVLLVLAAFAAASTAVARQPSTDIEVPQDWWLFRSSPEDTDADGIVDADDACPDDAEDLDGYEDADGCPEDTLVRLVFTDPAGLIETVRADIDGVGPVDGAGVIDVSLRPGDYKVRVEAPGFDPMVTTFTVANGPAVEVQRTLSPLDADEVAWAEWTR